MSTPGLGRLVLTCTCMLCAVHFTLVTVRSCTEPNHWVLKHDLKHDQGNGMPCTVAALLHRSGTVLFLLHVFSNQASCGSAVQQGSDAKHILVA